jgi:UDP-glucose 4-epimerase
LTTQRPQSKRHRLRAVVTGGAGFIGSHVVDAFIQEGFDVLVVDDLSAGSKDNVATAAAFERIDIADAQALETAVGRFGPAAICHLAAQSSVTVSVREPQRDLRVNVLGTMNVCEAARQCGSAVVFASTGGALYGDAAPVPTTEDTLPEPLAPYGASKAAGEAYVTTWGRLHGLANTVLRLGNVYGPRQNPDGEAGVVAIFSDRLLRGLSPTVYGDGTQTRDYIHVRDVARAFVHAAQSGRSATYNVGWGKEVPVLEILRMLQEHAGVSLTPVFAPLRTGELRRSALDSSRIREDLGWAPQLGLREGLDETFRSFASSRPVRR